MSTPEPTAGVPVWARKRRKPGNPLVGWVLVPLALFGAVTAGLTVREKSFAGAGAQMDGWVALAKARVEQVLHPTAAKPAKPAAKATVAPAKVEAAVPAVPAATTVPAPTPAPTPAKAPAVAQSGRKAG